MRKAFDLTGIARSASTSQDRGNTFAQDMSYTSSLQRFDARISSCLPNPDLNALWYPSESNITSGANSNDTMSHPMSGKEV